MRALICIPTYNEKDNVEAIAAAIFLQVPPGTDILFIDDGSPDGTGKILDQLTEHYKDRLFVLHRPAKAGLASAYREGFEWGARQSGARQSKSYDWYFEMDADFSHDPVFLPSFFAQMQNPKVDVICGSRYVAGGGVSNWDRRRLLLSRMASFYAQCWLRYSINDWTAGFVAWRADCLRELRMETLASKGYAFQIEMKYRAAVLGKNLVEVPIVFKERRSGTSKMSGSIVTEAIWGVARLRLRFEDGLLFV